MIDEFNLKRGTVAKWGFDGAEDPKPTDDNKSRTAEKMIANWRVWNDMGEDMVAAEEVRYKENMERLENIKYKPFKREGVIPGRIRWASKEYREPASEPTGTKHDDGKIDWDLLPWWAVEEVVEVLMYGAEKYGADNWKRVPDAKRRYFNAAMRHLVASKYEYHDSESGKRHLAHAVCCLLFSMSLEQ